MKQIIGFATQFYTLWEYEEEIKYRTDSYGNSHKVGIDHKYYYIKNISISLDKVKIIFPDVEIDMELRGTSSFIRNEKLDLPNNYFWFGKYEGRLIDEILEIDFQYCLWIVNNYNMPYILKHPKYISYIKSIEQQQLDFINSKVLLNAGDTVELEFTSNGYNADDEYNTCFAKAIYNDIDVIVKCKGLKKVDGMYPYIMPKINGKTKRTKGKILTVTVSDIIETTLHDNTVTQYIEVE